MTVTIKPHHLLDIFKLYGRGICTFSSNLEYRHDFHLVGNLIVERKADSIILVNKADDICKPCKHNNEGVCADSLDIGTFTSKHNYNYFVDQKLLEHLQLEENIVYDTSALLLLLSEKLSLEMLCMVWQFNRDNESRFSDTKKGIIKYLDAG